MSRVRDSRTGKGGWRPEEPRTIRTLTDIRLGTGHRDRYSNLSGSKRGVGITIYAGTEDEYQRLRAIFGGEE